MVCRMCYYRIHDGQEWVSYNRGDKTVPVHRFHAEEGKIILCKVTHNLVDEVVEWRAMPPRTAVRIRDLL